MIMRFVMALILVGIWVSTPSAKAQSGTIAADLQPLLDGDARQRVIVFFDIPPLAFDSAGNLESVDSIAAMDSARDNIIARALGVSAATLAEDPLVIEASALIHEYDYSPMAAMYLTPAEIRALAADPAVHRIQPDRLSRPYLGTSVDYIGATNLHTSGLTGAGVSVAVLDSGVDLEHPMFANRIVGSACFSGYRDTNHGTMPPAGNLGLCPNGELVDTTTPSAGDNCLLAEENPFIGSDDCAHGTHVAGIVLGGDFQDPNQPGTTLRGVAPAAGLVAVQVFHLGVNAEACGGQSELCLTSFDGDQVRALEWLYTNRNELNLAAINMSLGGGRYQFACDNEPQTAIIRQLRAAGIATIIASGNNAYPDEIGSPSCITDAITVGSVAQPSANPTSPAFETLSLFSNSGYQVDMLAPGTAITSAYPTLNDSGPGRTISYDGTSMATPHVAGAFALLRAAYPTLSVDQLENALEATGVTITSQRSGFQAPSIRVDAANAALQPLLSNNPETFSITPVASSDSTVSLTEPLSGLISIHNLLNTGAAPVNWNANAEDGWLQFGAGLSSDGGVSGPANSIGGTTGVGQTSDLIVRTDATGLQAGVYRTVYSITSDAGVSTPSMAVSMDVIPTPPNDNFANALALNFPSIARTQTVGATREAGEPAHAGNGASGSVWYRWTAPWTGAVVFQVNSIAGIDPVVGVYTGSSVGSLTEIASNDDFEAMDSFAAVQVQAVAGTTYYVAIAGADGSTGAAQLTFSSIAPPPNDDFESAQVISGRSGMVSGANNLASFEDGEPPHAGTAGGASLWFSWTAPADGTVWFDAAAASFATIVAAYNSDEDAVASAVGGPISFDASAGQTYRIVVDGVSDARGSFRLNWSMDSAVNIRPNSAVLPSVRTGRIGELVTAFATIIIPASASETARNCRLESPPGFAGSFTYQTTNPATNAATGQPNTPVDIAPGGSQSFVFGVRPSTPIADFTVRPVFVCDNLRPRADAPGSERTALNVGSLLITADNFPNNDLLAISSTISNDGIVSVPQSGIQRFSVAVINLGPARLIAATAGSPTIPGTALEAAICQSNPATGACLSQPATTAFVPFGANEVRTFTVIVGVGTEPIPLAARQNRVNVLFGPADTSAPSVAPALDGNILGGTSVAVRTVQ